MDLLLHPPPHPRLEEGLSQALPTSPLTLSFSRAKKHDLHKPARATFQTCARRREKGSPPNAMHWTPAVVHTVIHTPRSDSGIVRELLPVFVFRGGGCILRWMTVPTTASIPRLQRERAKDLQTRLLTLANAQKWITVPWRHTTVCFVQFSLAERPNGMNGLAESVVWCGVVWCGVVWCGVVWCGVVWCGVVWFGVVWCGVVWCGVVWCGVVWCGVVWCGVVWCAEGAVTKRQKAGMSTHG